MKKSLSSENYFPTLVKKSPTFCETLRLITAIKTARHFSLSWARSVQIHGSNPTSWRSVLILSSQSYLSLTSQSPPKADWTDMTQSGNRAYAWPALISDF
jgi:hypothetical protein